MSSFFIVAWVLSVGFTVLIAAGIVTYIRRTWQQIRDDSDGSHHEQLLDGIDQLQTQLYMVTERLGEIERLIAIRGDSPIPQLPGTDGEVGDVVGGAADNVD